MNIAIQFVAIVVAVLIDGESHNIELNGRSPARELDRKLRSRGVSRADRGTAILAIAEQFSGRRNVYRQFLSVASHLEGGCKTDSMVEMDVL